MRGYGHILSVTLIWFEIESEGIQNCSIHSNRETFTLLNPEITCEELFVRIRETIFLHDITKRIIALPLHLAAFTDNKQHTTTKNAATSLMKLLTQNPHPTPST
jgi:hypothetical protein